MGIVIPGKSGRSRSSTSPMFIRAREDEADAARGTLEPVIARRLVPGEEDEPVLADLDLVTVGELDPVDPVPVDVGAVQAADVADRERVAGAVELRVPPRDGHVVEEDLAVRVPAGGRRRRRRAGTGCPSPGRAARPGARARRAARRRPRRRPGSAVGRRSRPSRRPCRSRWSPSTPPPRLAAGPGARRVGRHQPGAALGAEAGVVGVLLATRGAERHRSVLRAQRRSSRTLKAGLRLTVARTYQPGGRSSQVRAMSAAARPAVRRRSESVRTVRSRGWPRTPRRRAGRRAGRRSAGTTSKSQPPPYGSLLTSSGVASSASLRATTSPADRRVDVADRLRRLQLAAGAAGRRRCRPHLGQRDVDDVAERVLGVVGDPDPHRALVLTGLAHPLVLGGVLQVVGVHGSSCRSRCWGAVIVAVHVP